MLDNLSQIMMISDILIKAKFPMSILLYTYIWPAVGTGARRPHAVKFTLRHETKV